MTSISLPLQPTAAFSHYFDSAEQPLSRHTRRNLTMSAPLPNPPFIFPARDPEPELGRLPETSASNRLPLPAFSFNPGSSGSAQPPAATIPAGRTGGHRRQYSEFVGSEQLVGVGNLGSNNTNDEELASSNTKLPAPGPGFSGGGRRRHAHRRSAAISSVDLTAISNALDVRPYAESAPCTPGDPKREHSTREEPHQPFAHSATGLSRHTPPDSPQILVDGQSLSSPNLADHQFADALRSSKAPPEDFDNTPQIHSETHRENEHDSTSFPKGRISIDSPKPRPRPKTADASLMLDQNGLNFIDDFMKRPLSASGHSRSHKSMSSGLLDATYKETGDMNDCSLYPDSFRRSSDEESDTSLDDGDSGEFSSPSAKTKSKAKKRQKKVRSWAGALLTRNKGKKQQSKKDPSEADSTALPPALTRTNSDLGSGLDVDFDDDNIVVIRTPTNPIGVESREAPPDADTYSSLENSWKPRSFYEQTTSSDTLSPVIDLDAALGPFNTPDMRSGRVPESSFSAATKRMYSGGRRGEFVGPEMRYHRRAESAPEMPPFDRSLLGSNRFTTTSTLENPDVFYEEEEDAFLAATSESGKDTEENLQTQPPTSDSNDLDSQSEDSKDSSDTLTRPPAQTEAHPGHSGLGIQQTRVNEARLVGIASSNGEEHKPMESPKSVDHLQKVTHSLVSRPKTPLESLKLEDWRSRIPAPPSPDVSPRFLPADQRPVTSPIELASSIPQFSLPGGCSFSNSSFPSPDFTVSSEAPRSITTSSTTDRNFSSPSYNPSMDFPHASVEDVPSLTSSASTMTNTLNRVSATFFSRPRLSTDRSASFSAAAHRRSSQPGGSKRSSLASLSKLVVGPHGERSKLSYEEKPPGDETEKAKKKGRRISRLMHFWRTKDKEKLNERAVEE